MAGVSNLAYQFIPVKTHGSPPKMKTSSKFIAFLALASTLAALLSSSCATVRGFGKDVGTVGHGIQKSTR